MSMVRGTAARELSLLECALLALLRQSPSSGYDLRRLFAETPFVHFSDSPGAVYPALRRLERRKLVRSGGPGGGRRRRAVRLTPSGAAALERWLRTPVTRDELTRPLDGPMLRFAFMEEVLGRPACLAFLRDYGARLHDYVVELRAYGAAHTKEMSLSGRLAFSSGLAEFKARERWAEHARRAITEARR